MKHLPTRLLKTWSLPLTLTSLSANSMNRLTKEANEREEIISQFIQKYVNGSYTYNNKLMVRIARNDNTPIEIIKHLLKHPDNEVKTLALSSYSHKKARVALYRVRLALEEHVKGSLSFDDYFIDGYEDWVMHDYLYETGQVEKCFDESQFNTAKEAVSLCEPEDDGFSQFYVSVLLIFFTLLIVLAACYS
jgi:hypothetical protein